MTTTMEVFNGDLGVIAALTQSEVTVQFEGMPRLKTIHMCK